MHLEWLTQRLSWANKPKSHHDPNPLISFSQQLWDFSPWVNQLNQLGEAIPTHNQPTLAKCRSLRWRLRTGTDAEFGSKQLGLAMWIKRLWLIIVSLCEIPKQRSHYHHDSMFIIISTAIQKPNGVRSGFFVIVGWTTSSWLVVTWTLYRSVLGSQWWLLVHSPIVVGHIKHRYPS